VGKQGRKQPEQEIAERYLKRISGFVKINERIIKPAQRDVREQDSQRILNLLSSREFVIVCDERGKHLSSMELSHIMKQCFSRGQSSITWVIGGAMGVSEELRKRANLLLSLSKMTFPHALAKIMMYEQVYRALCLRANHPYHHGD
jgi:23S rRNA (pseudouridine1915-N3)-methyltransferase